jgi:formamidopyrimidine-DNA glycosylase
MPELIECCIIAEQLQAKCAGQTIINVTSAANLKTLKDYPFSKFSPPALIKQVLSYGKKIIFILDKGYIVSAPLMDGRWTFTEDPHTRCTLGLQAAQQIKLKATEVPGTQDVKDSKNTDQSNVKDAKTLTNTGNTNSPNCVQFKIYFGGPRFSGNISYTTDIKEFLSDLGPDPRHFNISTEGWRGIYRKPKLQNKLISDVLLDQSLVCGIGNWLKAEILYEAGISPYRTMASLSDAELELCRIKYLKIQQAAYLAKGLTVHSYWAPDGTAGTYNRKIYERRVDPAGNEVRKDVDKTGKKRTHHWVPAVQK